MSRGMSPLAATLILILISSIMGLGVMSWGKNYIEERAEFVGGISACGLSIVEVAGTPEVCQGNGRVRAFVEANSRVDYVNWQLVGSNDIISSEQKVSMQKGESKRIETVLSEIGDLRQVSISSGSCPSLVFDTIREC